MKTSFFRPASLLAVALALAAATPPLAAQSTWGPRGFGPVAVQPVSPETENFALTKLAEKPVLSSSQEPLSTITDFLIDPRTGRAAFALVPSGSDTFRLVPLTAVTANPDGALVLRIDRAQWDKVGTITAAELKGRVTLNAEHQQRLAQQFSLGQPLDPQGLDALLRATSLRGQAIRSGNDQAGTIDDVAIDIARQIAAPIVKSSAAFTGSEQKFLLPFAQLQIVEGQNAFTTRLGRAQFQQAQAFLSPTGPSNAPFTSSSPAPLGVATAIQQAIVRSGAQGSVQAVPESRVVLRGTVESEQKKTEIENAARQAAPGVRVDSELTVRRW